MPVAVTVYASKEAAGEESPKVVDSENENEKMDEADDSNAAISINSDELGDEEIEEFILAQPTTSSTTYGANRVLEEIRGLGNKVVNYVEQPVIDEGAEEETLM